MSISYEEALATLQAMFGEPWTQDSLDTVLRHYQGHMENTVEALLAHSGQDPNLLLEKLKSGGDKRSSVNTSLDEQLARQLSSQGDAVSRATSSTNATSSSSASYLPGYQPRGMPTTLPDDFLRVQTTTTQSTLEADEALARMLQDQLFSEELRRNPDFAHLAGRPRVSTVHAGSGGGGNRNSFTARNGQQQQPMPIPNIMEKLSEMGTSAKFRLAQMAEQFKNNTNRLAANVGGANNVESPPRKNEMRGLLDQDDYQNDAYEMELGSRKDL